MIHRLNTCQLTGTVVQYAYACSGSVRASDCGSEELVTGTHNSATVIAQLALLAPVVIVRVHCYIVVVTELAPATVCT
jgi:hypothetical protein